MAEVVTSMTVTVSYDWINWMKGSDDSEDWKKVLYDFCAVRHIDVSDDGNVIHLSGNFEAIKDVRRVLQEKAKQALEKKSERIRIYKRSDSNDVTNGLEEKFEQMKIADPEGTEMREDTKQKRKRILKIKPESSEGEKPSDVFGSDGSGSDKKHHPDSSTNLIQIQVNQNQSTESQVWGYKSISLDEKMTKNADKPTNDLLHVNQKKPEIACLDSGQGEPQGHQQQDLIAFTDFKLSYEITPEFQRQIPEIHKSPYQGQMQKLIYPLLSQEQSAANSGQISQPLYTPLDHGQRLDHQGQMEQHSYPSQGQGQVTGHQGQTEQQSSPSQFQGQETGHQGQMEHHNYPSQDQGQVTGHQEQTEQYSYPSQGKGQVTGHQGQMEQYSYLSQGQGQVTGHQEQTEQYIYPSQGKGQVTGHQEQTEQYSYPSQGKGQVTGHQEQTEQYSYPSQGKGQVTGHQEQTEQYSYPSQGKGQVTGHQGSYPSPGPGQVTGHQGPIGHHGYPSQGHQGPTGHHNYPSGHQVQTQQHSYSSQGQGQVTGHQGQTEQQSYSSQSQGQETGHRGPIGHHSYPSQGQGQVTCHQGPMGHQTSPSQGQGQVTAHQELIGHHSYSSQSQGEVAFHQGPIRHHSYPLQCQGQVTGHQGQTGHPSYSSQGHMTGHQRIIQPFTNTVTPGQEELFHPSLPPLIRKQFFIKHAAEYLHFTSNRTYNVLNIFVHMGNIVEERTQVLVSSANCQLTTHGSVSEAILRAAGQSVVDECSQIISTQGFLPFGYVIPTKTGKLGPSVETILHAVIPTPQEFQINPQGAFNLLSQIFCSCLCMSAGQIKSVSFPAIGSEIFGLQRMVEAFTCGLQTFDQQCASSWPIIFTPGEIHFISNDPNKLKTILNTLWQLVT